MGLYYTVPEKLAQYAVDGERAVARLTRHETDVAGFHIVYLDGGTGEPLVLLHGFGADKENFTRVAKFLTPHYRVVIPDLPGFGESSKPADADYGIDAQVERVHAFVQQLGLKKVHLGGSSMGGNIAAVYAAKYPDETGSIWLLAPAGVSTAPPSVLTERMSQGGSNPLIASNADEFAAVFHFVMEDPPFVPRRILDVMGRTAVANHDLNSKIFRQVRGSAPLEPQVKGLQVPARIVWGEKDRALNVGGARILAGLMPNASVLILPGVGHLPMLERPREVGQDYLAFRDGLASK
ncbi:MAG: alpha/beta fold hydrolase [Rhizobium sp.]|nr:MAG: alpha/beta fold hydrolase [Rhizobium sp.]